MDRRQLGDRLQELVDRTLRGERAIHNLVLGVASGNGELRWSGAAGVADPATGRPIRPDTPFLIASVTKTYTAAAVMILRERGRLSLDDRISNHLPGELIHGLLHYRGRDFTDALTIRHLLGQTSGLPDYFLEKPGRGASVFERILTEGDRAWELEDVVRLTREEFPARFEPALPGQGGARVRAHYSDTNYKLLGAIVEAVTEMPLHAVFEELFFAPLGLDRTYLYGQPRGAAPEEPARVFHGDRVPALDRLMRSHGPEGGIVSTVADVLRFGEALMSGRLFTDGRTLPEMQRWNRIFFPFEYGYGLMRFRLPRLLSPFGRSPELVGHSGSSGSFLFHARELDLYMAGTINQMTLRRAPFALMLKVARMYQRASR